MYQLVQVGDIIKLFYLRYFLKWLQEWQIELIERELKLFCQNFVFVYNYMIVDDGVWSIRLMI